MLVPLPEMVIRVSPRTPPAEYAKSPATRTPPPFCATGSENRTNTSFLSATARV